MSVIERNRPGAFGCKEGQGCFAQRRLNQRPPIIIETHETAVERCIPVGGEQQSIEDIQSLIVAAAVRPCDDVARSQQRFIANASERATPAPIIQQCLAEIALPYPFLDDPIDLGVAQTGDLGFVLSEWECGQTTRQMKSPRQGRPKLCLSFEGKGALEVRGGRNRRVAEFNGQFCGDARVFDSQKPGRAIRMDAAGKRDFPRDALIGLEPEPPVGDAIGLAEAMVEGGLIKLDPENGMGRGMPQVEQIGHDHKGFPSQSSGKPMAARSPFGWERICSFMSDAQRESGATVRITWLIMVMVL